jgi:hypothetical protein
LFIRLNKSLLILLAASACRFLGRRSASFLLPPLVLAAKRLRLELVPIAIDIGEPDT